jgi:hypothetical protein
MRIRHCQAVQLLAILAAAPLLPAQAPPEEVKLQVVERPNPAASGRAVTVEPIKRLESLPEGFWAHGSFDDILLSNDQAAFVFGAIPENAADSNQARQGTIIDIFTSPSAPENFQLFQPTTLPQPRRTSYVMAIDYTTNPLDGSASVFTIGKDMIHDGISVDTNYQMRRGWPGVLVTTTMTNDGEEEITLPILGDLVAWGGMGTFIPSLGWTPGQANVSKAEFVFGRLHDSVILIAPKDGLMEISQTPTTSVLTFARNVALKPGESATYERWLLTAPLDPGALFSFVLSERGRQAWGIMAGRVNERTQLADGKFVDSASVPFSEVRIEAVRRPDLDRSYMLKPYIYTVTDGTGQFQISLPPGEYRAKSADATRVSEPSNLAIPIRAESISPIDHPVSRPATVVYEVVDKATGRPMPAKLSFVPLRGTSNPEFGHPGSLSSANVTLTATGIGEINVPPGNYRVVASAGNEYHTTEQRVRVRPATTETLKLELERAFDSKGWISADLGVLTDDSPRSRTNAETRVISAAAEGLDWIVTANPEMATFLQPTIERLGLEDRIRASAGFRLTSTVDRPVGDLLLFPIEVCNAGQPEDMKAILGATTPQDAITRLRALCPDGVLLANKPLVPGLGLLALQGVDLRSPILPEADIFADVDGIAVWEGKNIGLTPQSYSVWLQMVVSGYPVQPLAHSLSAGTYNQEPGYPRVYVASSQSNAARLNPRELAANIRAGRVQITNGPFIDLKANGQPIGSTVTARDGAVDLELRVYTPNWANVSTVTVNVNGAFSRKFIIPSGAVDSRRGLVFPTSGQDEDARFTIRVAEDSILQIVIDGDPTLTQDPVNPHIIPAFATDGSVKQGQTTLALTGPIFIDANGDGVVQFDLTGPTSPVDETAPPF